VHSCLHSLLKFYSKQKFVWFCYLVVFISTTFFAHSYLFLPGFAVKNNAVQYRSLRWENLTRCYEWKKLELTPLSDRICGLKLVQIEPISTHQKRGLCLITNWQFYWSKSYVQLSLKIQSQY